MVRGSEPLHETACLASSSSGVSLGELRRYQNSCSGQLGGLPRLFKADLVHGMLM